MRGIILGTAFLRRSSSSSAFFSSIGGGCGPPTLDQASSEDGEQEVVIAVGSNVGHRCSHFRSALRSMAASGIRTVKHSCLYESAPAYVTDQPRFLNSVVVARTCLGPDALLRSLKHIERSLGRDPGGIRYGPRPIDLDILFYGATSISSDELTIPHPRIWERPFVVAPLKDVCGTLGSSPLRLWDGMLEKATRALDLLGGDALFGPEGLQRVIPFGGDNVIWRRPGRTEIMGILNVTPDSFSDGGKYVSTDMALRQIESMVEAGADIIDIGAQSTRPGAALIPPEEELRRLLPIVEVAAKHAKSENFLISVDTFYAKVAREAVAAGVHIVNDVSGGSSDPDMLLEVAALGVPYILMHSRGNPKTMQNSANTLYQNICKEVADELSSKFEHAEARGVPAWSIIPDPGFGFAKTSEQNLALLRGLSSVRSGLSNWSLAACHQPMLIGPSRKGFLGVITGREKAEERDAATTGALVAGIAEGADIIRVHNVKDSIDAASVADAIFRPKGSHQLHFAAN